MASGSPALSPNLCIAARVRKASRRITQIYDRHLEPFDLTVTQFGIMAQIRALPGAGVGVLADRMIMDATTLSRNLRPLERRALVSVEADREDGRVRNLRLTPAGKALLERAMAGWSAAQRQVQDALGRDEAAALNATLDHALDRLQI